VLDDVECIDVGSAKLFVGNRIAVSVLTVIAVEPSQENAECLRRNLAGALTDGRAQICQKGLWDEAGMLTLAIDPHNAGGNSFITKNKDSYDAYQVPVLTIDQLVKELKLERVDFVKMDIEAAEQKALLGARETLTRFRPRLAIAVEHTPDRLGNAKAVIEIVRGIRPDYRVSGGHCYVSENNVILPEILYFQ